MELMRLDWREDIVGADFSCSVLYSTHNRRITVNKFNLGRDEGAKEMITVLEGKAITHGLGKIWLKSGTRWAEAFTDAGMSVEAAIPGYYKGREAALVMAKFLSARRQCPSNERSVEQISKLLSGCREKNGRKVLPAGISLEWGRAEHCQAMAGLYGKVFITYPFPVFDPVYLERTMEENFCYITAIYKGEMVAAASAEVNTAEKNAEVTDFATLPEWRGRGLAGCLLEYMERRLISEGTRCLYTIARSGSAGMNRVFAGAGYGYRGVLRNNCNISGGFEDMNVWSKIHGA